MNLFPAEVSTVGAGLPVNGYVHGRVLSRASPLLLVAFLTGCAIGPDYKRPDMPLPAQFSAAGADWQAARPGDFSVPERWWSVFADEELNRLEARLLVDNQNLKAAEAQYRAARASAEAAGAARLPGVSASADASRSRSKSAVAGNHGVGLAASWEIDLWGRVRRSIEAAEARASASASDLAAARLSAQALLAQTWFQWRATGLDIALLQKSQDADARFLDLTRTRRDAGVVSGLDVAQAETQLQNVRAQLSETELQRAQLGHALATLLGVADIEMVAAGDLPAVPPPPDLLPSNVLERRPDIAAAERLAAAANAGIGLAHTAYYPTLDLAASAGMRSTALSTLFEAPSRVWSLGPSLAMTLFDGGSRDAAVKQAEAGYDQAVATYRQTVLTAFQEVQDNLAAAQWLQREAGEQAAALAAARRAREIAEAQYAAGTVSALNVITAQTTELAAERAALTLHQRRLAAAVALLKNAGGRSNAPSER